MDIYLHIGWHKTGSTAVQKFLFQNRQALRERLGIHYPSAGLDKVAHNFPAWALQPRRTRMLKEMGFKRNPEGLIREMIEEAARLQAKAVLISSEEFSPIERYSLEKLARGFEGHRVIVIAYVRRQDEHIESTYNQMVKYWRSRYAKPLAPYVAAHMKAEKLNYHYHFGRWAEVFGKDSLRIRIYDRRQFPGRDARRDFCRVIGLAEDGLAFEDGDTNESLDYDSVCFLSRFNVVPLTVEQHHRVVAALRSYARENPARSNLLLDLRDRLRIAARFAESNRLFAREFFGRDEVFDPVDETADGPAPGSFDEQRFLEMLSFVLPRLLGANEAQPRALEQAAGRRASG